MGRSSYLRAVPLHLTDGQLQKVRELQELLVAPLRFPTSEAWIDAVHSAGTDLFGVERSLLVLPRGPDEVLVHSPSIEKTTLKGLDRALVGTAERVNRYSDPQLDCAMGRLAASGVEVWTRAIAERVSRIPLEEMPRFYPEVIRPGRLEGMIMMGASLAEGRAMFGIFPDGPERTALGDEAESVFRLLLPALKAGVRTQTLAARRWRRLVTSLDLLEEGVAVYRAGTERYRNRSLRRTLAAEDGREELISEIGHCARRLLRSLRAAQPLEELEEVSTVVTTEDNRYRIAASHLYGGAAGTPATLLVVVQPATPSLPDEAQLRERYGLTVRQAEVALLLAHGRSNREIAEGLEISPHTARHHAQRVLEKIGAASRKALALHFLADRRG